ncbi:MAG: hypothetical protein J6J17_05410 [Bacilli bacterium]|nr:hypothetical protein [Bacilli bacterium]
MEYIICNEYVKIKNSICKHLFNLNSGVCRRKSVDDIPDELCTRIIYGELNDYFTNKEIQYIKEMIGISYFDALPVISTKEKENIKKRLYRLLDEIICNKASKTSLYTLDLSVRSHSELLRAGIKNVEELLSYDRESLYNIRNLGENSVKEIIYSAHQHGYKFIFEHSIGEQIKLLNEQREDNKRDEYPFGIDNLINENQGLRNQLIDIKLQLLNENKKRKEIMKLQERVISILTSNQKNESTDYCIELLEKIQGLILEQYNSYEQAKINIS